MTRHLKFLLAALSASSALAIGPSAVANDGMCMANDKRMPDKSTTCRYGKIWVCDQGEWKPVGGSCSS